MSKDNEQHHSHGDILVVDDNSSNFKFLTEILSKAGYRVRPAIDGELALRSVRARLPELILLDYKMPGMNGIDLCRILKEDAATRDIPVIFLSGIDETELKVDAIEAGAIGFVTKPIEPEEILARIHTHLSNYRLRQKLLIQTEELNREIEERKRVEYQLRTQTEVIKNMTEGVYLIRENDGEIVYTNPACEDMFGYDPGEFIGKHASVMTASDEIRAQEKAKEIVDVISRTGAWKGEILHRRKDGTEFWSYVSVSKFDHPEFGMVFVATHTDITDRKQVEKELNRIFELSPDLIGVFDANTGYFKRVNPAWEMFGRPLEEFTSRPFIDFIHPDDQNVTTEEINHLQDGETTVGFVNRYRCKDGSYKSIEWRATPAQADGTVYATGRDITERMRMDEERSKIAKLESIGVLAGGIAHDLNNYLTGIVGNIGLAMMYDDPAEKDARLEIAEEDAMRVKELTQRLLTFSKGGMPVKELLDLGDVLREAVGFTMSGSNLGCDYDLPDDTYPVEIDAGQIRQVFNNLVINAQQAMPDGGKIRISAEKVKLGKASNLPLAVGTYVKISVEDRGVGIPEESRNRIFDPFFTTKPKGNGLGLATSFSIIQKHRGHISVESEVGVGTKFEVYLPASWQELTDRTDQEESGSVTGVGRILVMDDQENIRDIVERSLSELGYEVVTCIDGAETIEKYQHARGSGNSFQAVILDLTVPGGMGGKETIEKLKEIDSGVTAIVASGYAEDPVVTDYRDFGFRGAITKPYTLDGLKKVLHEVLNVS